MQKNFQYCIKAIKQFQEMSADLGGTNILQALIQGIYDENYSKNKYQHMDRISLQRSISWYLKTKDLKLEFIHQILGIIEVSIQSKYQLKLEMEIVNQQRRQ
ncbi:unnamed protein product [Paramecium primaurelia]|uniref:Uncharacterized protein n=1 Tax=Paramecium primaurelia TaxID=5886 RepID=A0A8S1QEQ3_PARPR|nr:unnamed protein product [Paramecium primaurelia]